MRLAWLVLLAACGNKTEEPRKQREPIKPPPPIEELDRLPDVPPPVPTKKPAPSLDQVLACFSDPIRTPVPESISSVTAGDFDNDQRTDVVVTYETLQSEKFTGHVVLYKNLGDARLREHSSVEAGEMVYAVSAGDIDNDGKLDLAVGDPRGNATRLFQGAGDGTFTAKPAIASGRKPYGATLVDLDGDHKLDLITELFSDVAIYKGDGKFGFKRRMVLDTGQAPDGPVVADLDGDGKLDLGYVANDESYFFTLEGNGAGFKQDVKEPSCDQGAYVSGGDFDDDGDVDVGYVCDDRIELRLNDGKGRFKLVTYPSGASEAAIVAGDVTGDGKTDLVITFRNKSSNPFDISGTVAVLEGLGGGEFREKMRGTTPIINDIKLADMDGDGKLDIVMGTWTGREAAILILLQQACVIPAAAP
jgi:hypothetical protein